MTYSAGTVFLEVAPSFDGMQNATRRAVRQALAGVHGEVDNQLREVDKTAAKHGEEAGRAYATTFGKQATARIGQMRKDFDALREGMPEKEAKALGDAFDRLGKLDLEKAKDWSAAADDMELIRARSQKVLENEKSLSRERRIGLGAIRQQADEMKKSLDRIEGPDPRKTQQMVALQSRAIREDAERSARRMKDEQAVVALQAKANRENAKFDADRAAERRKANEEALRLQQQMYGPNSLLSRFAREDAKLKAQRERDAQAAGALQSRAVRENVEMDLKIRRDSIAAEKAAVQREFRNLQADVRLGVIGENEARAKIASLSARLHALDRMNVEPDIDVDVSRDIVALRMLESQLNRTERASGRLRGVMARLNETGGAANAMRGFSGALLTIVSIGPMLIPILAGVAAGILGVGAAAVGVLGGIGVLIAAFSGIGGAVGAMNDLAKAQRTAAAGGGNQRAAAADARKAIQDARSLADAQRDLARARRDAAQALADSAQRVRDAEQGVVRAQEAALDAQRGLNIARAEAVRHLEDMNNQLASARLNERAGEFAVEEAAVHLNVVLEDDQATQREKDVAQLQYEQAVQRLKEQRVETKRLEEDTAKANKAGVEGSEQVLGAKEAIVSANERVRDAERTLADARVEFSRQQIAAAERVADAEENLARTIQDIAMRSEEADLATNELTTEVNNLREAMDNLSPAGRRFATFLFGLKPLLDDIRFAAQEGFLPGLQQGMQKIVDTYGPRFVTFVGSVAEALGDVAIAASEMFTNPFWEDFFGYIAEMAPDLIRDLGTIGLNLLTVFAGLMKAFAPIGEIIIDNLLDMTTAWVEWATTLESNPAFLEFIEYVKETWPKVSELIGNLFELLIRALVALEPYADRLLDFFISITDWLLALDDDTFGKLITGVVMFITGMQIALGLIAVVSTVLTALSSVVGIIIFAIVALAGVFIYLWNTNETFRDGVKQAWQDIQDAIEPVVLWFINDVLPVLEDFYEDVTTLFQNIKDGAQGVAEDDSWNTIKSVIEGLQAAFEVADTVISTIIYYWDWAFRNILGPVFQWLWAIAEPIIRLLGGMFDVSWQIISRVVNMISQIFTYILVPAFTAMWDKVRPIIEAVGSWWEQHVTPKIESFIETFGRIWNGWLDIFRTPIRLGIEWVINKGLIGAFNWIASKVPGMTPIDPVVIPDVLQPGGRAPGGGGGGKMQRAKDGAILDGYTPGRDVHTFYSASGHRLDLSGGEAVLVPELTRALGADWVNGANKAARRGEGLDKYLGGFARGGILDFIGDAWDVITRNPGATFRLSADAIGEALSDPAGFLRGVVKTAMTSIPGLSGFSGPMAEAVAGVATKPIDAIGSWIKDLFSVSSSDSQTATGAPVPGGAGAGMGWRAQWDIVKSQFPGANLHSAFRPGAITATGYPSMHGKGRAIDITPSAAIFDWLAATFPNSYELIYSPMGARQLYKGRSKVFGEPTRSMHYDHIHWAMANGGIMPTLYDTGGDVPPGLSLIANKTRKPEVTLTNKFVEEVRTNLNREGGPAIDARYSTYYDASPREIAEEWQTLRRDELAMSGVLDMNQGVF